MCVMPKVNKKYCPESLLTVFHNFSWKTIL